MDGFTYFLKKQKNIFVLVNYHCQLMDSLTSWRHKGSISTSIKCDCHLINLLTIWRHKGSIFRLVNYHGHLWIYLLPEDSRAARLLLMNYHCHLMDSHTAWPLVSVNYQLCSLIHSLMYFLKTQGSRYICISELPLSLCGFTYFLKRKGQHICISESSF